MKSYNYFLFLWMPTLTNDLFTSFFLLHLRMLETKSLKTSLFNFHVHVHTHHELGQTIFLFLLFLRIPKDLLLLLLALLISLAAFSCVCVFVYKYIFETKTFWKAQFAGEKSCTKKSRQRPLAGAHLHTSTLYM